MPFDAFDDHVEDEWLINFADAAQSKLGVQIHRRSFDVDFQFSSEELFQGAALASNEKVIDLARLVISDWNEELVINHLREPLDDVSLVEILMVNLRE